MLQLYTKSADKIGVQNTWVNYVRSSKEFTIKCATVERTPIHKYLGHITLHSDKGNVILNGNLLDID